MIEIPSNTILGLGAVLAGTLQSKLTVSTCWAQPGAILGTTPASTQLLEGLKRLTQGPLAAILFRI
jgi:hypothetical protein